MLNFVPLMGLSFGLMLWVESYRIFTIYGVFIFYIGISGTEVFEIVLKRLTYSRLQFSQYGSFISRAGDAIYTRRGRQVKRVTPR